MDEVTKNEEQQIARDVMSREWAQLEDRLRGYYSEKTTLVLPKAFPSASSVGNFLPKGSSGGSSLVPRKSANGKADGGATTTAAAAVPDVLVSEGESAWFAIELRNPLGVPLVVDNLSLVSVDCASIEKQQSQLEGLDGAMPLSMVQRAGGAARVTLAPNSIGRVQLPFTPPPPPPPPSASFSHPSDPSSPNVASPSSPSFVSPSAVATPAMRLFRIIGLRWSVDGVDGYYFLSKHSDMKRIQQETPFSDVKGLQVTFEQAIRNPLPSLEHPEYLTVAVVAARAQIEAEFMPPIPAAMRDGQWYRGELRLKNRSTYCAASNVSIQRSAVNAHLIHFPQFSPNGVGSGGGVHSNENSEKPLLLEGSIEPGAVRVVPIVLRAMYSGRLARCINNVVLLIGYASSSIAGVGSPASPTAAAFASPTTGGGAIIGGSKFSSQVRMTKILRRVAVRPSMNLQVAVLPAPATASSSSSSASAATTSLATLNLQVQSKLLRVDAPMRVCRVALVAHPFASCHEGDGDASSMQLGLQLNCPQSLQRDQHISCLLSAEQSLSISLSLTAAPQQATQAQPAALQECVPVKPRDVFAPHPAKAALIERALGSSIVEDPSAKYFLTRCDPTTYGCGTLGAHQAMDASDMSFYLDKAGGKSPEELEEQRKRDQEKQAFGGFLRQFPPVCVAVSWCVDEDGTTTVGQHFLFVDVAQRLLSALLFSNATMLTSGHSSTHQHSPGGLGGGLSSATTVMPNSTNVSTVLSALVPQQRDIQQQMITWMHNNQQDHRQLIQAFDGGRTAPYRSPHHRVSLQHAQNAYAQSLPGLVLCSACALPRTICTTADRPFVAQLALRCRYTSLCPTPVVLTVTGRATYPLTANAPHTTRATQGASLVHQTGHAVIVGKSKSRFLLLPGETFDTVFQVECWTPGLTNVNALAVECTPVSFSFLSEKTLINAAGTATTRKMLRTGDAPPTRVESVVSAFVDGRPRLIGANVPWIVQVLFVHPLPRPRAPLVLDEQAKQTANHHVLLDDLLSSPKSPEVVLFDPFSTASTSSTNNSAAQQNRLARSSSVIKRARGLSLVASPGSANLTRASGASSSSSSPPPSSSLLPPSNAAAPTTNHRDDEAEVEKEPEAVFQIIAAPPRASMHNVAQQKSLEEPWMAAGGQSSPQTPPPSRGAAEDGSGSATMSPQQSTSSTTTTTTKQSSRAIDFDPFAEAIAAATALHHLHQHSNEHQVGGAGGGASTTPGPVPLSAPNVGGASQHSHYHHPTSRAEEEDEDLVTKQNFALDEVTTSNEIDDHNNNKGNPDDDDNRLEGVAAAAAVGSNGSFIGVAELSSTTMSAGGGGGGGAGATRSRRGSEWGSPSSGVFPHSHSAEALQGDLEDVVDDVVAGDAQPQQQPNSTSEPGVSSETGSYRFTRSAGTVSNLTQLRATQSSSTNSPAPPPPPPLAAVADEPSMSTDSDDDDDTKLGVEERPEGTTNTTTTAGGGGIRNTSFVTDLSAVVEAPPTLDDELPPATD